MLFLNPSRVVLGPLTLTEVSLIAIDRSPNRLIEEWGDEGSHCTLADVPEQRTGIRIVRRLTRDDLVDPRPGQELTISFAAAANGSDAARRAVSATCIVTSVTTQLAQREPTQTITLLAISKDGGVTDPVSIAAA